MTILHTKLAKIDHGLYQSIFDYRKEFQVFHPILGKHSANRVLELGCGAGNLASYFLKAGYSYMGMDVAKPMLRIARRSHPEVEFIRGDMRRFSLSGFDAVIIGGRSFTYMTANEDVRTALACVKRALRPGGILIFDNFEAGAIFENLHQPLPPMCGRLAIRQSGGLPHDRRI